MLKHSPVNEVAFILPEDGGESKKTFLSMFDLPDIEEIYICAFGFTMDEAFEKIKTLDSNGIAVNLLLDVTQARGPGAWLKIVDLHKNLKHGSVVLTTAGVGSKVPGAIWHFKAMVVKTKDTYYNFEGSINFSDSGWNQGNSARYFQSEAWAVEFINHFKIHRDYAMSKYQNKQINYYINNPVEEQDIDEQYIEYSEQITILRHQLDKATKFNGVMFLFFIMMILLHVLRVI